MFNASSTYQPINQSTNQPQTYLALGDSYTIGEAVQKSESFPFQTAELLRKGGFRISDPDILAVTGWTTGDLLKAIEKANIGERYDIVSLLIGVNNQYQGKPLTEYENEFRHLVHEAIRFARGLWDRLFILSIPDYSVTPFAAALDQLQIHKSLKEFNAINRTIAKENNVHYIEIMEDSRMAGQDRSLIASDGLHFSAKEYLKWARKLSSAISGAGILRY